MVLFAVALWLLDPVPWLVIAVTLPLFRRWLDWRLAFAGSTVLGAAGGFGAMYWVSRSDSPNLGSAGLWVFIALCDALIAALILSRFFASRGG
jgi:hypothetical protein